MSHREVDGGVQLPGAPLGDAVQAPNSESVVVSLHSRRERLNSGGESRQSFIQVGEIASGCLFFGLLISSWLIVGAVVLIYQAIVS
jgi:hypothetical protein